MSPSPRRRPALRHLWYRIPIAIVVVTVALLWAFGALDDLTDPPASEDPTWLATFLYLIFIIVLGALGVPSALLIAPLPLVWAWTIALPMGLVGGLGAAVAGFLLSRHVAQDFLDRRIPEKVRRYERLLEQHALGATILLRLMFFLFPPVNWLLGLSHIPLGTYFLGTLIGSLPGILVLTLVGDGLLELVQRQSPWLIAVAAVPVLLIGFLWLRYIRGVMHRRLHAIQNGDPPSDLDSDEAPPP